MDTVHPAGPTGFGESSTGPFRGRFAEAVRYWEPRRLFYNIGLTAITVGWIVVTWPHFREALTMSSLGILTVLALLANVCYSAAYLVDIPMQLSSLSNVWRRRRWLLWLAGTLFAFALANYWIADEIYPYVR
jgi:hypothetical protein